MSALKGVGIGAGYFSQFHYEAWARIPEVEMAAVCDRDLERATAAARRHAIPRASADWRETIERERPDFLDVITPPETHEEICAFAAARGVAIVCQKPLAPSVEAAERMAAGARTAGVRLMAHENWRWQPWYRAIRRVREAGDIGEFTHILARTRLGDGWGADAYLARQPFFRDYPRLLVYETGVHFIDTFRFLLGEVEEVYARLRRLNPAIRGEDTGQILLRFAGGATAIWDANRYNESEARDPRYTFCELRLDAMGGHLEMDATGAIRIKRLGEPVRAFDYDRPARGFAGDSVYALQRHFVDCLLAGAPFESAPEDYLRSMRAAEAAYESHRTGQTVRPDGPGRI
jgi:predicted dehydrogenase